MKFYRARETDGPAGQTFDLGSQSLKKSYQSEASPSVILWCNSPIRQWSTYRR